MHLVDEADNKSRFLALIHTCGKWAVWTVGGTSGRDHTLNSKLPGTRLPSNYSPYLHWLFFFFYYDKPFIFCLICVVAAALKQSTVNSCTTFMTHGGLTPALWLTWLRLPRGPSVMRRVAYLSFVFSVRYILHASEVEYFHKRHIFILTLEFVFIGSDDTL